MLLLISLTILSVDAFVGAASSMGTFNWLERNNSFRAENVVRFS